MNLSITYTPQAAYGKPKVNLRELEELAANHISRMVRRLACLDELRREGDAIKARYPHLSEEVDFIIQEEAQRRSLAQLQRA